MTIVRYTSKYKNDWNTFARNAKNGHFLFQRDFMEYHADRFIDASLLVLDGKNNLLALLPANQNGDTLCSHQGLTFGGFIVGDMMKTAQMLEIFELLKSYSKRQGFKQIQYKCIPYIYHRKASEEDRYALFRNEACLVRRDVTSTVHLSEPIRYSKGRKSEISKAKRHDITISECPSELDDFWEILMTVLKAQHSASPVHSQDEMTRLMNHFPKNIRLFLAKKETELLAGALIFENEKIAHTQYLANSPRGRTMGAMDLLIHKLIADVYSDKQYFDFGISNEDEGRTLNEGLIYQKEGFGARAVAHDFYTIEIA